RPEAAVLLVTWPPAVRLNVPTFSATSPARPRPVVAAEIVPPSLRVSDGAETAIRPAFPVPPLDAVLKRPLATPPLDAPRIETGPCAVSVRAPPPPAAGS